MKDFKQLKVWQRGIEIAAEVFKLTQSFPKDEKFGLIAQMTRAAVSIPSNIAEGSSKSSEKDYRRYLEIALGSSYELETQLIIAEKSNFGDKITRDGVYNLLQEEQKMLLSFIYRIKNA